MAAHCDRVSPGVLWCLQWPGPARRMLSGGHGPGRQVPLWVRNRDPSAGFRSKFSDSLSFVARKNVAPPYSLGNFWGVFGTEKMLRFEMFFPLRSELPEMNHCIILQNKHLPSAPTSFRCPSPGGGIPGGRGQSYLRETGGGCPVCTHIADRQSGTQ